MEEVWKDIKRFPEYRVSNLGRVMRWNGYEPRCNNLIGGYERVRMWSEEDNRYYSVYTHYLVADAFLDRTSPTQKVKHKNGNRTDNRPDNLEVLMPTKVSIRVKISD